MILATNLPSWLLSRDFLDYIIMTAILVLVIWLRAMIGSEYREHWRMHFLRK
jgi:hypothetical protein